MNSKLLCAFSLALLIFVRPLTSAQDSSDIPDLSKQMKVVLTSKLSKLWPGTFVTLDARLINISKVPLAVAPSELGRYVDYSFEPEAEDGGSAGQVIGDSLPGAPGPKIVVLGPGVWVSRSLRFPPSHGSIRAGCGQYRVTVDYCHFHSVNRAEAIDPAGCVTSNELVLPYEP